MSRDSLSGQNRCRRAAGLGSSPSLSILPKSQKTRLWKRLREYDRKISKLKGTPAWYLYGKKCQDYMSDSALKVLATIEKLDAKRKEVRNKLKGY